MQSFKKKHIKSFLIQNQDQALVTKNKTIAQQLRKYLQQQSGREKRTETQQERTLRCGSTQRL
jgi:hypothetical protein